MSRKKTPEEYYNECKYKGLDLPIEDYINAHMKIKHVCSKGHIYEQTPHRHLSGNGCPMCNKERLKTNNPNKRWNMKKMYDYCKENNLDLPKDGQEYTNLNAKYIYICPKHGEYYQVWKVHKNGHLCKKCSLDKLSSKFSKGYYTYLEDCKTKGLDLPLGIEDYVNAKTIIHHRCKICGYIYSQIPNAHLNGQGCPVCNESHGERYISNYLDNHSIKYIPQKKFHDLKDKNYLSYDFYLPDYTILIEYQGKQHYDSIDYFGGDSKFKNQQYHDKLKREYAKDNGYKLLELHYSLDTQDKVDKYLKRRIK